MNHLKAWCKSFEVGEPVRSWLKPTFKIKGDNLYIDFTSIDIDRPKWLQKYIPFRATFVAQLPSNIPDEHNLHLLMREALHHVVVHETDEAIRVRGTKTFDPHYEYAGTLQACGGGGGAGAGAYASAVGGTPLVNYSCGGGGGGS